MSFCRGGDGPCNPELCTNRKCVDSCKRPEEHGWGDSREYTLGELLEAGRQVAVDPAKPGDDRTVVRKFGEFARDYGDALDKGDVLVAADAGPVEIGPYAGKRVGEVKVTGVSMNDDGSLSTECEAIAIGDDAPAVSTKVWIGDPDMPTEEPEVDPAHTFTASCICGKDCQRVRFHCTNCHMSLGIRDCLTDVLICPVCGRYAKSGKLRTMVMDMPAEEMPDMIKVKLPALNRGMAARAKDVERLSAKITKPPAYSRENKPKVGDIVRITEWRGDFKYEVLRITESRFDFRIAGTNCETSTSVFALNGMLDRGQVLHDHAPENGRVYPPRLIDQVSKAVSQLDHPTPITITGRAPKDLDAVFTVGTCIRSSTSPRVWMCTKIDRRPDGKAQGFVFKSGRNATTGVWRLQRADLDRNWRNGAIAVVPDPMKHNAMPGWKPKLADDGEVVNVELPSVNDKVVADFYGAMRVMERMRAGGKIEAGRAAEEGGEDMPPIPQDSFKSVEQLSPEKLKELAGKLAPHMTIPAGATLIEATPETGVILQLPTGKMITWRNSKDPKIGGRWHALEEFAGGECPACRAVMVRSVHTGLYYCPACQKTITQFHEEEKAREEREQNERVMSRLRKQFIRGEPSDDHDPLAEVERYSGPIEHHADDVAITRDETVPESVAIGDKTKYANKATAVGYCADARTHGTAVGRNSTAEEGGVAVGDGTHAKPGQVVVGGIDLRAWKREEWLIRAFEFVCFALVLWFMVVGDQHSMIISYWGDFFSSFLPDAWGLMYTPVEPPTATF